jgi:hypothetical protein
MRCSLPIALAAVLACSSTAAAQGVRTVALGASVNDSVHLSLVNSMKADLNRLVRDQEAYYANHATYTASLSLEPSNAERLRYRTAEGFSVKVGEAHKRGWSGTMTAMLEPGLTCGVFVGGAVAPNAAVVEEGRPACWRQMPDGRLVSE